MTETPSKRLSENDKKAISYLQEMLTLSGAGWATEQQWRAWADRPSLRPLAPTVKGKAQDVDPRARGFRIVDLLASGKIEESQACFHAMRPGMQIERKDEAGKPIEPAPMPIAIYRPV